MSATQLGIYNKALVHLGERRLATIVEAREPRRVLDDLWDAGSIKRNWLERGQWNFAARPSSFEYSPSVQPSFGFIRAFDKPTDWVRTLTVSADPYMKTPFHAYRDAGGFWFADIDVIYVNYVSDDAQYGGDLSLWPTTFEEFAAVDMAQRGCLRITSSKTLSEELKKDVARKLSQAATADAASDAPPIMQRGFSWAGARWGGGSFRGPQG